MGFLTAVILRSGQQLPASWMSSLAWIGKFLIIAAMTAIGLNSDVPAIIKAGPNWLVLGALTWFGAASSSPLIQFLPQRL